jgi:predicted phage tail protein
MNDKVDITLHGVLAKQMPKNKWKLKVKNVSEAIRGIESNSGKFYNNLLKNDRKHIKYRILINGRDFMIEEGKDVNNYDDLRKSELTMDLDTLKTIDIVPVIEGSKKINIKDVLMVIAGIAMIAVGGAGLAFWGTPGGLGMGLSANMAGAVFMGGLGLVSAGVTNMLTPMPKFGDFREIEQSQARAYLFNGPQNTVREGGPVFVAYGRLLVGSHVIQTSMDNVHVDAEINPKETWGISKKMLLYNIPDAGNLVEEAVKGWEGGE